MTKEEIIHRLQYARHRIDNITFAPDVLKAIDIAIETVSNTDTDTISRRAVKEILDKNQLPYHKYPYVWDEINALPPAQPELIEKAAYIRGFEQGRTQGMIDAQGGKK